MRKFLFILMFAMALIVLGARPSLAQVNCQASPSPCVTLTGKLASANGMPASDFTLTFQPSQTFFIAGQGVVLSSSTYCGTTSDGSVVGVPDPASTTTLSPWLSAGLPAGTYYVQYTFYTSSPAGETLPSPEQTIQLTQQGGIQVNPPASGVPSNAAGMRIYIGTTSGGETLQGYTTGSGVYNQLVPLVAGTALPSSNTTLCQQVANDAGWPSGTGYKVALTDSSGNAYPGYPMMWQLLGPGTTINLSNGLPYYHGTVIFPAPILASPLNHATQSINGPLSLGSYPLSAAAVNTTNGFQVGGQAPNAYCLVGNGTYYVGNNCNGIALQTNSVSNGSQVKLNLKNGDHTTVTDDGVGGVTIANVASYPLDDHVWYGVRADQYDGNAPDWETWGLTVQPTSYGGTTIAFSYPGNAASQAIAMNVATGAVASTSSSGTYLNRLSPYLGTLTQWTMRVIPQTPLTNTRYWAGMFWSVEGCRPLNVVLGTDFAQDNITSGLALLTYCSTVRAFTGFRYSSGTDTTWKFVLASGNGTIGQTAIDTAVTVTAGTEYDFKVTYNGTSFTAYINGAQVASIANPLAASYLAAPMILVDNKNTAQVSSINVLSYAVVSTK
jgi:hypothetical protein